MQGSSGIISAEFLLAKFTANALHKGWNLKAVCRCLLCDNNAVLCHKHHASWLVCHSAVVCHNACMLFVVCQNKSFLGAFPPASGWLPASWLQFPHLKCCKPQKTMEDKCNCWNEHAGSKCGSVGKKSWAEWAQIGGSSKGITDHQCIHSTKSHQNLPMAWEKELPRWPMTFRRKVDFCS